MTIRPRRVVSRFPVRRVSAADTEPMNERCPACAAAPMAIVASVHGSAPEPVVAKGLCEACGHLAFTRVQGTRWHEAFYRSEFETAGDAPPAPPERDYSAISELLAPLLPGADASLLDLGCGYGSALQHFRRLGYTRLAGLEVSDRRAAVAATLGCPISRAVGEAMADDPLLADAGPFDAIWSWHVVEHMTDPLAALRNGARLLKPGGLLFVAVPHADAEHIFHMAHYTPHIHSFCETSMRALMERAGFEVVYQDSSLRTIGRLRGDGREPQRLAARSAGERLRQKLVRDLALRTVGDGSADTRLEFTDYRGNREILEPSWGRLAGPGDALPQRAAALLAARLGQPPSETPHFLDGSIAVADVDAPPARLEVRYDGVDVPVWIK